jgi:hypothetical protein
MFQHWPTTRGVAHLCDGYIIGMRVHDADREGRTPSELRTRSYIKLLLFTLVAVILLDVGYFVIGPMLTDWIEHG